MYCACAHVLVSVCSVYRYDRVMYVGVRSFLYATIALLIVVPIGASAADINFSPSAASHSVGKQFTMTVAIDPDGGTVNASDGTITFDKDLLTVVGISKDGSAFSLWTSEPTFSNAEGTINYSGGSPAAFSTKGTVLTISFKGKSVGSAKVTMSKGTILAADGKGTDVFKNGGSATFDITAAAAEPPPPPEEPETTPEPGAPVPIAPLITSPTHPKPESWYATTTAIFNWKPTTDVIGMRMALLSQDNLVPTTTVKGIPITQTYTGLHDGVWYFYLQYKNDIGWGAVGKQKFQIDSVAPKAFSVALIDKASDGEVPKLAFLAEDELSGVDRYEIILGSTTAATIQASDVVNGAYPVPPQEGGPQEVSIKAYDKAGNVTIAKSMLTLPFVAKPKSKAELDAPPPPPTWTSERILLIILSLIIGGLIARGYYAKKAAAEARTRALQYVLELRDKNDRVFSAMREEFEKLINDFDVRPQLTPQERKLLEDIKEVLDIAEGVVDTSIEELKREVRGS